MMKVSPDKKLWVIMLEFKIEHTIEDSRCFLTTVLIDIINFNRYRYGIQHKYLHREWINTIVFLVNHLY